MAYANNYDDAENEFHNNIRGEEREEERGVNEGGGGRIQSKGFVGRVCSCLKEEDESKTARNLRIGNLLNALLLMVVGVVCLLDLNKLVTLSLSFFMLSFFLTCFGCLLCCFEMRFKAIERTVRDLFGFMYTNVGRSLFLLFLASFCFGLVSNQVALGVIAGIVTMINAILNFYFMWKYGNVYKDPTMTYSNAEQEAAQYIAQNPELTRSAVNTGMRVARDNPQAARTISQNAYQ